MHGAKPVAENLVAHRGYQANYPENTQLSLTKAIEAGARYIELDVQFSRDQLPIIYHDASLQRVSGCSGAVKRLERQQLLTYPAYEPARLGDLYVAEKIAPLEALVGILRDNPLVTAFVELKEGSIKHCGREHIIDSVQKILKSVAAQTVLISFDCQLAIAARESNWPHVGLVLKRWRDLAAQDVAKAQPEYIFVNHRLIPSRVDLSACDELKDASLVAYEVGNSALAERLLARGVAMLESFDIGGLLAGK